MNVSSDFPWMPLALAVLLLASGCSSKPEWQAETHLTSGECHVNNLPAHMATMVFFPRNGPIDIRETLPYARVGEDGVFHVSTYELNDGCPVGEYDVIVSWPADPWDITARDRLHRRYDKPDQPLRTYSIGPGFNSLEPIQLTVPDLLPAKPGASSAPIQ